MFGAVVVGVIAQLVIPGIWVSMAFALGAILGPTDAVAVSRDGAQGRTAATPRERALRGESLVNDGTALTLLRVCSVAAAPAKRHRGEASIILLASVLGGSQGRGRWLAVDDRRPPVPATPPRRTPRSARATAGVPGAEALEGRDPGRGGRGPGRRPRNLQRGEPTGRLQATSLG